MSDLTRVDIESQLTFHLETIPEEKAPEPAKVQKDWRAEVPTVAELTRRIRGHVEGAFFDVWVKGEISSLRKPASGHAYFVLKDATSQLRSVMFRMQLSKLKFQIQDGMEVLLHGQVTVYEARGEYQIVADNVEPVGQGALQLAFEQLKKKLEAEGLFKAEHKKKLPFLPKRIGIVTSPTGAAVKDILKVLHRRYPDREVILFPCLVQGEKAAPDICSAISRACRWNKERPERALDVLIVGRGGGSMEDLWCFNEETVARSIFNCPIPIISAVGHEIDFTISDFVGDIRAPTPSAAAEMVIPRKEELLRLVDHQQARLGHVVKKKLDQLRLHLGHLGRRLIDPRLKIAKLKETFQRVMAQLTQAGRTRCLLARRKLEHAAGLLNSLSPLQVLGRGYSITYKEGDGILRSVKDLTPGTVLETRLADGTVRSSVLSETR